MLKYARWDGLGIQTMWAEHSNNVNYSEYYALLITISGYTQLIPHLLNSEAFTDGLLTHYIGTKSH